MTNALKTMVILFSDKPVVPPLLRALSLEFEDSLGFAMGSVKDAALAQRFNVQKTPTLLVMFPDESKAKDDDKTQVPLTGMQFMPQHHGKFNFGNIANFLSQVKQMREQMTGGGAGACASGAGSAGAASVVSAGSGAAAAVVAA